MKKCSSLFLALGVFLFRFFLARRVQNELQKNLSTRFYSYTFTRRRYEPDVDVYQVPSSGFLEFRVVWCGVYERTIPLTKLRLYKHRVFLTNSHWE